MNSGENTASSVISDAGTGNAASGSISGELVHDRQGARPAATAPAIMDSVPQTPDQQARDAVTARITARVTVGWPRLGEPVAGYRGQYCYVAALLPGHREATPILRLRWQGCAGDRAIGICKASTGHYSETELPGAFAGATGTPGQGIGETFILYAGPGTGN